MHIDNYINTVCEQIRCKRVHKDIEEELKNHINDQRDNFILQGLDEQTATLKAIEEMGDPVKVGFELDCTHRPKPEWSIIILTGIVLIIGLIVHIIMLNINPYYSNYTPSSQIIFCIIGIILSIIIYFMDYTILGKYPKYIYFAFLVFNIFLINTTRTTSGVIRISNIGVLFVPIYGGIIYSLRGRKYEGIILSGICFLLVFFIMARTNVTYLIQVTICCLIMLTISIIKGWFNSKKYKAYY